LIRLISASIARDRSGRGGRLLIDGETLHLCRDGSGTMESGDGSTLPAARSIETLPGGREHASYKLAR